MLQKIDFHFLLFQMCSVQHALYMWAHIQLSRYYFIVLARSCTLCLPIDFIFAQREWVKLLLCPKKCYFYSPLYIIWLTLTSQIKSIRSSKYTPLYERPNLETTVRVHSKSSSNSNLALRNCNCFVIDITCLVLTKLTVIQLKLQRTLLFVAPQTHSVLVCFVLK